MKLDLDIYLGVNEVIRRLNNLRRWPSIINQGHFNELAKQALNCIVTYVVASYCEQQGQKVCWERFPGIALYRAFKRAFVLFETIESNMEEIFDGSKIPLDELNIATRRILEERTNREFMRYIVRSCNTPEERMFRASIKIGTYIEVLEMRENGVNGNKIQKLLESIKQDIALFNDVSGVKLLMSEGNTVFPILMEIAGLRNSNRWAAHSYIIDCNVLGHLFDTAIFAYLIALEKFCCNGQEEIERMSAKFFFMGIWHDVAEAWTGDMPSDIKDRVNGLREATELYEEFQLNKNLYSKLPGFMTDKIKEVMFEEEDNLQFRKWMKGADYLSADSECCRQYVAGSRDSYFLTSAIMGFDRDLLSGFKAYLTPVAYELHSWFLRYAKSQFDEAIYVNP